MTAYLVRFQGVGITPFMFNYYAENDREAKEWVNKIYTEMPYNYGELWNKETLRLISTIGKYTN